MLNKRLNNKVHDIGIIVEYVFETLRNPNLLTYKSSSFTRAIQSNWGTFLGDSPPPPPTTD